MKNNKAKQDKKVVKVEAQIEELSSQVADLDTKLRSALADYQNLKRELEKQHEMQTAIVKKRVFSDLIEIFTDLFFALEQLPSEVQENPSINGVFMIVDKYRDLLKSHGVTEITMKEGDDYDSAVAEVLGVVDHSEMNGKVAKMIQPGYMIGEVMIKPAKVMIYKRQVK